MTLFRCHNVPCSEDPHGRLIFDFESDLPICPKCKKDQRRFPSLIITLAIIHLIVEDDLHGKMHLKAASYRAACNPNQSAFGENFRITTVWAHVNCKLCKASKDYLAAKEEAGGYPELVKGVDYEIAITPDGGVVPVDGGAGLKLQEINKPMPKDSALPGTIPATAAEAAVSGS